MSNLHIHQILKAISSEHVTPGLEQHHGNWSAGKHETNNEFRDNVQASLLVGDSLDHT